MFFLDNRFLNKYVIFVLFSMLKLKWNLINVFKKVYKICKKIWWEKKRFGGYFVYIG